MGEAAVVLSTARKIQVVADAITGKDIHVIPSDLDEPWSGYLAYVHEWIADDPADVDIGNLLHDFYQEFISCALKGREIAEEHYRLIRSSMDDPLVYPPALDVVENLPDLEWLWPDWIPIGLVSLLAAVPGTGKSYLSLDWAFRVVTGATFPDGKPVKDQGPVIYVDAENTPSIFKKRVQLWQDAALRNVYLMLPDPDRLVINLDDIEDRERLWDMCWTIHPTLVILDSYGSVTLRGENNKEDVQQLLAFLNKLAKDFRSALLVVHHLRKRSSPQTSFIPMTIDSIRGSSHIPAMARNVLGLQWIPTSEQLDENGPRRLWVMKSNLSRYPEPIGVFFDPHPDNPDIALIRYGEAPQPYRESTKSEECAEWLEDLLTNVDEPMSPKEIVELGKEMGFSRRTIYRARQRLGKIVNTEDSSHHSDNKWAWEEVQ